MQYKIQVTSEDGKVYEFNLTKSVSGEDRNLNDFILNALLISEDKRKLPFFILTPNHSECYPSIKMKFENYGSPILGDRLVAMAVTSQP